MARWWRHVLIAIAGAAAVFPFSFNLTWAMAPAGRSWMGQRSPRAAVGLETMAAGTAAEDVVGAAKAMGLAAVEAPGATVTAAKAGTALGNGSPGGNVPGDQAEEFECG